MTDVKEKLPPNAWHAPPNARSEALRGVRLVPPTPEEAADLIAAADETASDQLKAYQTPVTEETLRQKVS